MTFMPTSLRERLAEEARQRIIQREAENFADIQHLHHLTRPVIPPRSAEDVMDMITAAMPEALSKLKPGERIEIVRGDPKGPVHFTIRWTSAPQDGEKKSDDGLWCPYCKIFHARPSIRQDSGKYTHFCEPAGQDCDCGCPPAIRGNPQNHDGTCRLRYS